MVRTAVWILTALTVNTLAVLNIRPVAADDTFLFEKDGFRIHYVGNGGNCYGCDWIAIDGRIPADAGEYLQGFIERNQLQGIHVYVYLNSPGGSLIGAIRLGRVIRNLGLDTAMRKPSLMDAGTRQKRRVLLCVRIRISRGSAALGRSRRVWRPPVLSGRLFAKSRRKGVYANRLFCSAGDDGATSQLCYGDGCKRSARCGSKQNVAY